MSQIQIETAQNVQIELRVADLGQRLLAYIIDTLIIYAYWIGMFYILYSLDVDFEELWVIYMLLSLPAFMYYVLLETATNGKTVGKSAAGIRVVRIDGNKPTFSGYFVRWILRLVDVVLTSGGGAVLTILFRGNGQRIGDIAAGTTVISERKRMKLDELFRSTLTKEYVPQFPQVTFLSDDDMATIKDLYYPARRKADHKVLHTLATKIKEITGIQTEMSATDFIEVIIKDFTFYTEQ